MKCSLLPNKEQKLDIVNTMVFKENDSIENPHLLVITKSNCAKLEIFGNTKQECLKKAMSNKELDIKYNFNDDIIQKFKGFKIFYKILKEIYFQKPDMSFEGDPAKVLINTDTENSKELINFIKKYKNLIKTIKMSPTSKAEFNIEFICDFEMKKLFKLHYFKNEFMLVHNE